jgi:biopolymer transport protein TolR
MPKLEPMQQPSSRPGGRRARVMRVSTSLAEINVVPMIDVMLVLLVIFMVAAPMMHQGFPVQLPESRKSVTIKKAPVTVTVPVSFRKDRRLQIDNEFVSLDVLAERIRQELSGRVTQDVVLAADGQINYQELVSVFDQLKQGGVQNISLQTQPPTGRKAP